MSEIAIEAGSGGPTEEEWVEPATPAARLWARLFDSWLLATVLSLLIGGLAGLFFPTLLESPLPSGSGTDLLVGFVILPVALFVDALILAVFGTTPGKLLAGIRVETLDGRPIGALALRRNLRVYVNGMFLGLPLLSFFAMVRARDRLLNEDMTSWDEELGTRVVDRGSNELRTVAVAVLAIALQIGSVFFARFLETREPEWERAALVAALPEINQGLPRFLDDVTRFDRVDYRRDLDMLSVEHTLIHRDGSPVTRNEIDDLALGRATLLSDYCGPDFQAFRRLGIPVRYVYGFDGGGIAFETLFASEDCRPDAARPPAAKPLS